MAFFVCPLLLTHPAANKGARKCIPPVFVAITLCQLSKLSALRALGATCPALLAKAEATSRDFSKPGLMSAAIPARRVKLPAQLQAGEQQPWGVLVGKRRRCERVYLLGGEGVGVRWRDAVAHPRGAAACPLMSQFCGCTRVLVARSCELPGCLPATWCLYPCSPVPTASNTPRSARQTASL